MSDVIIFHNPDCGTSRNTLALIRHAGRELKVTEYLKTPPSTQQIRGLLTEMQLSVRQLLREKGAPYEDLGLSATKWTDDQLLDFIMLHSVLMNCPVVRTSIGTKLCRPSAEVLELLPVSKVAPFEKEDGEMVVVDGVRRAWRTT